MPGDSTRSLSGFEGESQENRRGWGASGAGGSQVRTAWVWAGQVVGELGLPFQGGVCGGGGAVVGEEGAVPPAASQGALVTGSRLGRSWWASTPQACNIFTYYFF